MDEREEDAQHQLEHVTATKLLEALDNIRVLRRAGAELPASMDEALEHCLEVFEARRRGTRW